VIERIATEEDIKNIRNRVITGRFQYGMNECLLCGSKWMRRPNTEVIEHKDCIASPIIKK